MSADRYYRRLAPIAVLIGTAWAGPVYPDTICTHISTGGEHPVPLPERESLRQVQARVIPELVKKGDGLVDQGRLAEAAEVYSRLFDGFVDERGSGLTYQSGRCLSSDVYRQVADKLGGVASKVAAQRVQKGHYLDESHSYGGDYEPGALRLLLDSNQYDEFRDHAFKYAVSELPQRDIDEAVVALAESRIGRLERTRNAGASYEALGYQNDLTPLLDQELVAFDKLAGLGEQLRAHLAPLYPKITDSKLAEEARNYENAIRTDGIIPKGMMFGRAFHELESGISRLSEHPKELARLRARASERAKELFEQEQYQPAEEYFEIAGNEVAAAESRRLAATQQDAMLRKLEVAAKTDIEKMKKSDEERDAFQDEAAEMAAEFGLDLEQ